MNDNYIDSSHPDEGRKLLKKHRKERRKRRKERRKEFGKNRRKQRKQEKKIQRNKKKRKGGFLGKVIDLFCCEACCVLIPVLFGLLLFVAAMFVISVDKIMYASYKEPKGHCTVASINPLKVSFVWDQKNFTREVSNVYYVELNLQVGNIVPCSVNSKHIDSNAAIESEPQLIDLLSYVILGVSVVLMLLFLPFLFLTLVRCICCNCYARYCFKCVLVCFNAIYLIFWLIFFLLFVFGLAHVIIGSKRWYDVKSLEKKGHVIVGCEVTSVKCDYVFNEVQLSYYVEVEDSETNNGTIKHFEEKLTEPLPNFCYKKGNILPCILNKKALAEPNLYYLAPPSRWFWWIFGVVGGLALLLSCITCCGCCCLYPWFILEVLICGVQMQTGVSKRVKYEALDDSGVIQ